MWKSLIIGVVVAASVGAQTMPVSVELANLREDVRGLVQRVGELSLRVEQLERENAELRARAGAAETSNATVAQLNEALADVNRAIHEAAAAVKNETLRQVATQMEALARQTNAALDSLAKAQATRAVVQTSFSEDYPREGVSYTVQRGDTIAEIAKKTGAKQQDIVNANRLQDPSRIMVGQVLFIPGGK